MPKHKKTYRYWTTENEKYLKENYGVIPTTDIAELLDRTTRAIQEKAAAMGITIRIEKNWSEEEKKRGFTLKTTEVPGRTSTAVRSMRSRERKKK